MFLVLGLGFWSRGLDVGFSGLGFCCMGLSV